MGTVDARELEDDTRELLDRVDAGETITITVNRRAVAELRPVSRRPRTMSRAEFVANVLPHQADPALRRELRALLRDTTDDIPPK